MASISDSGHLLSKLKLKEENNDLSSEEEEDDEEEVLLGFVEKMEDLSDPIVPPFVSKAGGAPEWLDPINLPTGSSCLCDFCSEPLQFVLQDYLDNAESESSCHRAVYVFTCQSIACLLKHQHQQSDNQLEKTSLRSVKVFRCQLPLINPFYSSDGINKAPSARGVALCCWCGTWKGDKLCSGCKSIRYCSKVHQAMHWRSGHKSECKRLTNSDMPRKAPSNTLWPEYVLSFDSECKAKAEAEQSTDHGNVSLLGAGDEFDGMVNSSMHNFEGHDDKSSWASFEARMAKDPNQVLRCPKGNGKPLWPRLSGRPTKSDIPRCRYCSGPLRFEFQIMPQLLYYFHVENEADSLDWATIAVYTCDASCDKTNVVYKEEFAWVQLQ
ncbi:Programmed cell death protein 2-like protein [Drosera capensis]